MLLSILCMTSEQLRAECALNLMTSGAGYSLSTTGKSFNQLNPSLFVQNTMNVDGDLKVYLYKSFIEMVYVSKDGGKNEPDIRRDETHFKIYRVIFDFNQSNHF